MTYGDGVANVDIRPPNRLPPAPTASSPPSPPCACRPLRRARARRTTRSTPSRRSPDDEGGWINGGFFVLSPKVIDEVKDDRWMFERQPIEALVAKGEVQAFPTTASGRPWTPSATSSTSKSSGPPAKPHGKPGRQHIRPYFTVILSAAKTPSAFVFSAHQIDDGVNQC